MGEVRVAAVADVVEGRIKPVEAGGHKLLLAKAEGTIYAAARKCPHLGFNLCRGGKLDGAAIVCPLHKAEFDLATGRIERDPRLLFLDLKARGALPVYPVRSVDGDVLVTV